VADAARLVEQMTGTCRIPDALRLADRLARGLQHPVRNADHARQQSRSPAAPRKFAE